MKRHLVLILFLASVTISASAQGSVEVKITNIKEARGNILIAIFNNSNDFLNKAVQSKVVKATAKSLSITFENLPAGDYAVSIVHDENANGELDKNMVGMPKEGFAFGNNAMGTFGPPSFEKASVKITTGSATQEISMRYL